MREIGHTSDPEPEAPRPPDTATTPMFRQYHASKAQHQDAILLFRMGDFYEMFFEDAVIASKTLDLALTRRGKGTSLEAPMCGVPVHAAEAYIARLVRKGHRVGPQGAPRALRSRDPRRVRPRGPLSGCLGGRRPPRELDGCSHILGGDQIRQVRPSLNLSLRVFESMSWTWGCKWGSRGCILSRMNVQESK